MTDFGSYLLDAVIVFDDERGHIANATVDELRESLRLAASRLREAKYRKNTDPFIKASRLLVAEVWTLVDNRILIPSSRAAYAANDLRMLIDVGWTPRVEEERRD